MLKIFAGVVLGTLGAWFLLPRVLAEVILTLFVLAAAVIGIYWVCAGSSVNEIVEGIGIFTLLASVLGCVRVRVAKVSDKLAALLPPPFGTKSKRPQSAERLPAPVFAAKTACINEVEPLFPAAGDPQRSVRMVGLSLLLFSSCVLFTACGGGGGTGSTLSEISSCVLLYECSGLAGGSTSNNNPPGNVTFSGNVIQGPVGGSTLTISTVNADGSTGTALGSTATASDGSFTITLSSAPSGAIRLTATNGSYTSEANTATTVSGVALSALVPSVSSSGAIGLVVTPLSTFSDQRAQALIAADGSVSISSASTTADTDIKQVYGIQDTSTPLSTFVPSFTTSSGDAATIALTLGALEQLALQVGKPPEQVVSAIAQDLTDGVLDGKAAGGNPIKYQISDTSSAPSTLGSTLFLNAVSAYTTTGNTDTIAAQNEVTYTAPTITALRSGVVAHSGASSGP